MTREAKASELENEMRPEYDLRKMKLVGRGVYAKRFRAGVKFVLLNDDQVMNEHDAKEDRLNEQPGNISNPKER